MTINTTPEYGLAKLSRRALLKALPALTIISPALMAQTAAPIAVRKLHSFALRVSDMDRSLKFYQDLFGAAIQSRQGDSVCLRIGDGPRFFSLSPLEPDQQPGIAHIGLSVANFDLESVRSQLDEFGISRRSQAGPAQASIDAAMQSWINTRGDENGGSTAGTEELFFADIEGLIYQLSPENHCGGSGDFGTVCESLENAPAAGLFKAIDLSHFTNFLANRDRANEFYTRIFDLGYQAYQGPTSPIVGVGDGIQFLMYLGGSETGAPTQAARVDHVCLSVEDFAVDGIIASLENYGFTVRASASNTPPLVHWISRRMPDRGGVAGGTPEVYFSDPDGIRIQLQDAAYCGGGGYLGDDCRTEI